MASSCWEWWRAPAYFSVSMVLAFIAISTNTETPSSDIAMIHQLSLNASSALRTSGFNIMATLIQISPDIFFSSSSNSTTIFALQDSSISNASLPPALLNHLLRYHTSPSHLPFHHLLHSPPSTCFPSLVPHKNISITNINHPNSLVEINHVLISHPNIFLAGPVSIHGVLGPFSHIQLGFDSIQPPICGSSSSSMSKKYHMLEWSHIVSLLNSNGFVSFALGLHSVLNRILEDFSYVHYVTIFSPPDLSFVSSPSPLLYRIVRFHILPQRYTYKELASMPDRAFLRTLLTDRVLNVSKSGDNFTHMTMNGVGIVQPDMLSAKRFVIHGISRALDMPKLPYTS